MRAINLSIAWATVSVALVAGPAAAADTGAERMPAPLPLQAEVKTVGGAELIPTTYACAGTGTNRFSLRILETLNMDVARTDRITFSSGDYTHTIVFQLWSPVPASALDATNHLAQDLLLAQAPMAKILETFSLRAMGQGGPAFDFELGTTGSTLRRGRAVFIPTPAGILAFTLLSTPAAFESGRQELNLLLLGLRSSDRNGKLQLPVIYGKS